VPAEAERDTGGSRLPLVVCALLTVVLGLIAAASGGTEEEGGAPAAPRSASVETIARRVERIRGLRFDTTPRPRTVSGEEARREGLDDLDRSYPTPERRADEELYKLLGLLAPADDLREIFGSVFGDQVAGYYDPRSGALRIVEGGGPVNRVLDETTVAHELDHALEDQRFDLELGESGTSGDAALANLALVEGTATALMNEYQRRHFRPEEALGGAAAGALAAPSTASLPPFVTAQLLFPYLDGERFVGRLYATGRDSWRLVDLAERVRPPVSTEQILHPEKYLAAEPPRRVRLRGVGRTLGPRWSRVAASSFGEWQTREWLARGGGGAAPGAAAGWAGDRYELWRSGSLPRDGCRAPCVADDALVMRWHWDTTRDADEFRAAVDDALEEGLGGRRLGRRPGEWTLRGGVARVVAQAERRVTLVLAPDRRLAAKLAGA